MKPKTSFEAKSRVKTSDSLNDRGWNLNLLVELLNQTYVGFWDTGVVGVLEGSRMGAEGMPNDQLEELHDRPQQTMTGVNLCWAILKIYYELVQYDDNRSVQLNQLNLFLTLYFSRRYFFNFLYRSLLFHTFQKSFYGKTRYSRVYLYETYNCFLAPWHTASSRHKTDLHNLGVQITQIVYGRGGKKNKNTAHFKQAAY